MHTATGPGIASKFVVIRESNYAHFLMSFRSDKVNALGHKKQPWTCNLEALQGERTVSCIHSC